MEDFWLSRAMTSPRPELPNDITGCHVLIGQLRAERRQAEEHIAQLQSAGRDAASRISHLEALLAEYQETIATHQQTIEHLTADNKLLKRSLFGSRRERYEDPSQALLFDVKALKQETPQDDEPPSSNGSGPARDGSDACFPTSCHGKSSDTA